jgi:hypothetical protein
MKDEGNAAKRTSILMAAFGKSGNVLSNMLGDLNEQLEAAGTYGNIVDPKTLAMAEQFNDTISRIKKMTQAFGDVIRGKVVQYLLPLLEKRQEWIATNQKFIKQKIEETIEKGGKAINRIISGAKTLYGIMKDWGPLILSIVAGIMAFEKTVTVLKAVKSAFKLFDITIKSTLFGPIGLIVAAVAALVVGFIMLTQKVGGFGNALEVVGKTALAIGKIIIKAVFLPINLFLNYIIELV